MKLLRSQFFIRSIFCVSLIFASCLDARLFFITDMSGVATTGTSDTGAVLSGSPGGGVPSPPQVMSSYSGLTVYAAGDPNGNYVGSGELIGFSASQAANTYFATAGNANAASPTGYYGENLIMEIVAPIAAGGEFSVTFQFPSGLTVGRTEGTSFTPDQGATGVVDGNVVSTAPYNPRLAFATRTGEADADSWAADVALSGVLYNGGAPDFGMAGYGTTGIQTYVPGTPGQPDDAFYHFLDSGTGTVGLSSGDSVATFTNNTDGTDLGAMFVGSSFAREFAFSTLTATYTAGADGFSAGQQFRFSLDGAPVAITPVPEPSRVGLLFFGSLLWLRRRR